jgi:hypothetical protein
MRFFIALVVFAVGLGLYAAAALLFDRRRTVRGWLASRQSRGASRAARGGVTTAPAVTTTPVYLAIAGCLVVGTLLVFGSCAGLVVW